MGINKYVLPITTSVLLAVSSSKCFADASIMPNYPTQVEFGTDVLVSILQYGVSMNADFKSQDLTMPKTSYGTGYARASLETGQIRVMADGDNFGQYPGNVWSRAGIFDRIYVTGFTPGGEDDYIDVILGVQLHGTFSSNVLGCTSVTDEAARICSEMYGRFDSFYTHISPTEFDFYPQGTPDVNASRSIQTWQEVSVRVSESHPYIQYGTYVQVHAVGDVTVDFGNTASVGVFLPEGYSYTTASSGYLNGYGNTVVRPVPELPEYAMIGMGLIGVAAMRLRQKRKSA